MATKLIRTVHKLTNVQDVKKREEALNEARMWVQERDYENVDQNDLEIEFGQLWQGIFWMYWLTDKELVQEKTADNIANIIHLIDNENAIILWLKTFFSTLHHTWIKLDKHRMSKYLMLVRFMFQQTFAELSQRKYPRSMTNKFIGMLKQGPFSGKEALLNSLQMHIADIFVVELKQFGSDNLDEDTLHIMLDMFFEKFTKSIDASLYRTIVESILEPLSIELDVTLDDIEDLEEEKQGEGGEDLELVVLPVNYKRVAESLAKYATQKKAENREEIYAWKQKFEQYWAEKQGLSGEDVLDEQARELEELQNANTEKPEKKDKKKKQPEKKVAKDEAEIEIITPAAKRLQNGEPLSDSEDEDDMVLLEGDEEDEDWEDVDDEDDDVFGFNADGDDFEEDGMGFDYDIDEDLSDSDNEEEDFEAQEQAALALYAKKQRFMKLLNDLKKRKVDVQEKTEPVKEKKQAPELTVTVPPTIDIAKDGERRVIFSLKDNKTKMFSKDHIVIKSPLPNGTPVKGLLKRKIDQLDSPTETVPEKKKIKNPPIAVQQPKKRRKK